MKAAGYIKILVKSILQQSMVVPFAALYYKIKLRKPGVYNLIVCDHIGDFLYVMGYARAFQAQKQIRKLRIVSTGKFQEIAEMYTKLDCGFCGISKRQLHLLCIANRYVLGQQLFASWKDNCVIEPANGFQQGFEFARRFPGLHLKECICYGALGLKEHSQFDLPSYAQGGLSDKIAGCMSKARKVLLCPDAQSVFYEQAKPFFQQLAKEFEGRGWQVFVNVERGHRAAIQAIPVRGGFQTLCKKMQQLHCVIGLRSGLLDLAAFAPCKVIALYPPACGMDKFYDLRHTNPAKKEVYQYRLTDDRSADIDAVLQIVAG